MNEAPDSAESVQSDADVSVSARGADAAELAERTDVPKPNPELEGLPAWNPPVSPEWQRDCRRNGAAIVSLFLVALLAWVTASQTFIVLNGNKLVHPSSLSWPLYICLAGIVVGGYVFVSADRRYLPIRGREFEKPDHRTKYSLWFQEVTIEWHDFSDEPDTFYAQVGIWISNGGRESPIVVEVEKFDVELNGVKSPTSRNFLPLRLLPNQRKRFMSDRLDNVPHGNISGTVTYSLKYGPVNGFPVYRRTHKVRFQLRMPITPSLIRSGVTPGLTWTELEPEIDIDVYPEESQMAKHPSKQRSSSRRRAVIAAVIIVSCGLLVGGLTYANLFGFNRKSATPIIVVVGVPRGAPDPRMDLRIFVQPGSGDLHATMSNNAPVRVPLLVSFGAGIVPTEGVTPLESHEGRLPALSENAGLDYQEARQAGFGYFANIASDKTVFIGFTARTSQLSYVERSVIVEAAQVGDPADAPLGDQYDPSHISLEIPGDVTITSVPVGATFGTSLYSRGRVVSFTVPGTVATQYEFDWTDEEARTQREFLLFLSAVVLGALAAGLLEIILSTLRLHAE